MKVFLRDGYVSPFDGVFEMVAYLINKYALQKYFLAVYCPGENRKWPEPEFFEGPYL